MRDVLCCRQRRHYAICYAAPPLLRRPADARSAAQRAADAQSSADDSDASLKWIARCWRVAPADAPAMMRRDVSADADMPIFRHTTSAHPYRAVAPPTSPGSRRAREPTPPPTSFPYNRYAIKEGRPAAPAVRAFTAYRLRPLAPLLLDACSRYLLVHATPAASLCRGAARYATLLLFHAFDICR